MLTKRKLRLLAGSATAALLLAACGTGGSDDADSNGSGEDTTEEDSGTVELPLSADHEGEAIDGGTLDIGMVSDSPFTGIFNYELSNGAPDARVMAPMYGSLVGTDETDAYDDSGPATVELDQDTNTVTITITEDLLWHDGEPVTADDVLFSHEIIADAGYEGVRFSTDLQNIIGIMDYHNGEADEISGITVVDDNTLEIEYESVGVQMLQAGGGVWAYATPRHHLGHLEVSEMEESPEVRENPIGFGPFQVENIVPGESVSYTAFEDYWAGAPTLDRVELEVIPPSTAVTAMENETYDTFYGMPTDQYDNYEDVENYTVLGDYENSYTYIGFKLGTYEDGESVPDPDLQTADVNLRQAMAYAIDNDAIGANFYHGLRERATSPIIPYYGDFYNEDVEGYSYDPERANEILDEAGYEWESGTPGEGYRLDPEGEELTLTFASMSGGETAEPMVEYYMQSWAEVGINVELLEGRLHEFNSFYDRVEADDPDIDIYQGAWSTGSDPTPDGLYGRTAAFNYTRWATEENDELMAQMLSDEGFDREWRIGVFHDWQEYFMEEVPVIPTLFRQWTLPVHDRVGNLTIDRTAGPDEPLVSSVSFGHGLSNVYLTSEER